MCGNHHRHHSTLSLTPGLSVHSPWTHQVTNMGCNKECWGLAWAAGQGQTRRLGKPTLPSFCCGMEMLTLLARGRKQMPGTSAVPGTTSPASVPLLSGFLGFFHPKPNSFSIWEAAFQNCMPNWEKWKRTLAFIPETLLPDTNTGMISAS